MRVLPDPDERDVDRRLRQLATDALRHLARIPLGVEQVVVANAGLVDQALAQVPAKARGMVDRQADVLVEMEHLDARPVDAVRAGERLEEIELRGPRGGHNPGPSVGCQRRAQHVGGLPRRGAAHRQAVGVGLDLHSSVASFRWLTGNQEKSFTGETRGQETVFARSQILNYEHRPPEKEYVLISCPLCESLLLVSCRHFAPRHQARTPAVTATRTITTSHASANPSMSSAYARHPPLGRSSRPATVAAGARCRWTSGADRRTRRWPAPVQVTSAG